MSPPDDRAPSEAFAKSERIRRTLARVPLFATLDEAQLRELAQCARIERVQAGQVIIGRGDPAQSLFAIERGKLKVVAPRQGARDATLHILSPGEVFGEVALFQEKGRTARVTALEDAELVVIDRRDFLRLLERSSELSQRLLTLMARRLQDTIEHFDVTTSLDVSQRLARRILSLAEMFGAGERDGPTNVAPSLSQTELADLADTSRQTVNRLLGSWRDQGILRVDEGKLVVLDCDALRRCAGLP